MTGSGVCRIMVHSEFSTHLVKLDGSGASWLFLAVWDRPDESLLAKYLLLLLLPVGVGQLKKSTTIRCYSLYVPFFAA